jgi:hypothetical protein
VALERSESSREAIDELEPLAYARQVQHPVDARRSPDDDETIAVGTKPAVGHHNRPKAGRVDEGELAHVQDEGARGAGKTLKLRLERVHPGEVELPRELNPARPAGVRDIDLQVSRSSTPLHTG